jgi:hypothetical protein
MGVGWGRQRDRSPGGMRKDVRERRVCAATRAGQPRASLATDYGGGVLCTYSLHGP